MADDIFQIANLRYFGGHGRVGHDLDIILRLVRPSENKVNLLQLQQWFRQLKARGGRKIMMVKEKRIFPKIVEVCERVSELFGGSNRMGLDCIMR